MCKNASADMTNIIKSNMTLEYLELPKTRDQVTTV